jgi:hypothetical protein
MNNHVLWIALAITGLTALAPFQAAATAPVQLVTPRRQTRRSPTCCGSSDRSGLNTSPAPRWRPDDSIRLSDTLRGGPQPVVWAAAWLRGWGHHPAADGAASHGLSWVYDLQHATPRTWQGPEVITRTSRWTPNTTASSCGRRSPSSNRPRGHRLPRRPPRSHEARLIEVNVLAEELGIDWEKITCCRPW